MAQHVMVIGSERESADVVSALRERGLQAWSDRIGHAALDFVSLDWADALVVIDRTPHVESRHLRPVTEFHGPRLLATPALLAPDERAALYDRGFDAVIGWPAPAPLLAAFIDRFLSRSTLTRLERMVQA